MTRYILEIDRSSDTILDPGNDSAYLYGRILYNTEKEAREAARGLTAAMVNDIHLTSIYKVVSRTKKDTAGTSQRIAVYRDGKLSGREADATLEWYTITVKGWQMLGLVVSSECGRYDLASNHMILS